MAAEEPTLLHLVEALRTDQQLRWRDGEPVRVESYFALHPELLTDPQCALQMVYNADGRRLFTSTGRLSARGAECRSWRVGSREPEGVVPVRRSSSSPALLEVAPDGTVPITHGMSDVRLLDPETLDEQATLVSPVPETVSRMAFNVNGGILAVVSAEKIGLWDLRYLRRELAAMGLDW